MGEVDGVSDDWQNRANCRDVGPDLMQPEVATADQVAAALAVCEGCPVRAQCLALAKSQADPYGVHAGRWFGPPPRDPSLPPCEWCGAPVTSKRSKFCCLGHRVAAHRARSNLSA